MTNEVDLKGLIVPLITPLDVDRNLDVKGMENLVTYLLDNGVDGLFIGGTTGEFAALPREVLRNALDVCIEKAPQRVPVYYGVSSVMTKLAIEEAKWADDIGVDAIVSTPPFYYNYSQDEISRHYEMIVSSVNLPCFIYNIPKLTRNGVALETVRELSKNEFISGIKDTSGDMDRFQRLVQNFSREATFHVAQGTEELLSLSLQTGAEGIVTGVGNILPELCNDLYNESSQGNYKRSMRLQSKLIEVFEIYSYPSFLAALKYVLSLKGICDEYLAYPFSQPTARDKEAIESIMSKADLMNI